MVPFFLDLSLLQNLINRDVLKLSRRRAGRRPASLNGGRAAGRGTASIDSLSEAANLRKSSRLILH